MKAPVLETQFRNGPEFGGQITRALKLRALLTGELDAI